MTMVQVQSPVMLFSQLLLRTALTDVGLLLQLYEFTPEELATAGITSHSLSQLQDILDRLTEMVESTSKT